MVSEACWDLLSCPRKLDSLAGSRRVAIVFFDIRGGIPRTKRPKAAVLKMWWRHLIRFLLNS